MNSPPAAPQAALQPLGARAERAVKWSALTVAARLTLQLGAQVALARVLGPGNYGIYGIGIAVLTFAGFLAGSGFSYSLMLQAQIAPTDIRLAFTWQLLAGCACALALLLIAPVLADYFREPGVTSVLRWLALACLLTAASGTAVCLLQRELDFRGLGLIQLAAYATGYLGLGLPLALAGWGADALALACVVQAGVVLAGCWWRRPHPLQPLLRPPPGSLALVTGRTVIVTNLVNWLLGNLDRLIIGRVLHTHAVGLYTLAWNLSQIPVLLLVDAAQPTFVAAGAKIADDRVRLRQAWHQVMAGALVLVMPIGVALALVAPDLVALLYGAAWREAGWVLGLLFLCLPAWACWGMTTPVLWNTGRKHLEARLQWPLLILAVPAWWLLTPFGLTAAAIVTVVMVYARSGVIVAAGLRALDARALTLLPLAGRGAGVSLGCGLAVVAAQAGVSLLSLPPTVQAAVALATGSIAALATGLLIAWALPELLGEDARQLLARVLPSMRSPDVAPPVATPGHP